MPNTSLERTSRGLGLLTVAVLFLLSMAVLSFTSLACHLWCKSSESYPEAVFLLYGMPLGIVLVLGAGYRSWRLSRLRVTT